MKTFFIFCLFAFALSSENNLSPSQMAEIEKQIELRQSKTNSLQMKFAQSVLPPHETKPILSTGTLYYKKAQLLRIDFLDPLGEGMLLTPTQTIQWKKEGAIRIEEHQPDHPSFRRIILDILERKPSDWSTQFSRKMDREKKSIQVTLTPLTKQEQLPDQVQVTLRASDYQLLGIEVTMRGLRWKVNFSSIQVNPKIDSQRFEKKQRNNIR